MDFAINLPHSKSLFLNVHDLYNLNSFDFCTKRLGTAENTLRVLKSQFPPKVDLTCYCTIVFNLSNMRLIFIQTKVFTIGFLVLRQRQRENDANLSLDQTVFKIINEQSTLVLGKSGYIYMLSIYDGIGHLNGAILHPYHIAFSKLTLETIGINPDFLELVLPNFLGR